MSNDANPYNSPGDSNAGTPVGMVGPKWIMQYSEAYEYVFRNPQWLHNGLMGGLCLLSTSIIPIVGQLVWMGYCYEVVEALHRSNGSWYPNFDFNRFGDYLQRAIGPFLAGLVFTILLVAIILVSGFGMIALVGAISSAAGANNQAVGISFVVCLLLGAILLFPLGIFLTAIVQGASLKPALSGNIGDAFDFAWAWDFAKKTWVEMIFVTLFMMLIGIAAELIGLLLCFIGLFFTMSIFMLVQMHFTYQLYRLYLSRGGQPVLLKPVPMGPQMGGF